MAEGGEGTQQQYQRRVKVVIKNQELMALRAEIEIFKAEVDDKLAVMEELLKEYFGGPPRGVTKRGPDQGSQARGDQTQEAEQAIHDTEVVESNALVSSGAPRDQQEAEEPPPEGRLKRKIGSPDDSSSKLNSKNYRVRPSISTSDPIEDIMPTDIMGERMTPQGNKEVLVKWKGWPWNCCTWEPAGWLSRRYPEFHLEDKVELWEAGIDRHRQPSPDPWRPQMHTYWRRKEAPPERHRPSPRHQQFTHEDYGRWELGGRRQPRGGRIKAEPWEDNPGEVNRRREWLGDIEIKQEPMETFDGGGGLGGWIWE